MAKSYKSKSDNIYKTNKNDSKCQKLRARMKSYCRLMEINESRFAEELEVNAAELIQFMKGKNDIKCESYKIGKKYLTNRMPFKNCNEQDIDEMKKSQKIWSKTI